MARAMTNHRCFLRVAGASILLCIVVIVGALGYRAYRQQEVARVLAIHSSNGIQEAMFVKIGGIEQWVQIRGQDQRNPVLLIVHGGPGVSLMAYTPLFHTWEKYFTVVQWDQRGDGRTYGQNGQSGSQPVTIDQMSRDGIELSQFLLGHLHKPRLVLLGHSWGSVLALRMVKLRPDLFYTYVGTGQIVSEQADWGAAYTELLQKVTAAHDQKASMELAAAGPPPYKTAAAALALRKWLDVYGTQAERDLTKMAWRMVLVAPNYSLIDIYNFWASARFSGPITYDDLNRFDARKLGKDFNLPIVIIEGDSDLITPASFARRYFDDIRAPKKTFITLHSGGHSAMLTMPDRFLDALLMHVRPLADPKP
jgi:pimeloyl-ACP methyl ester carboxylesterase